MAYLFYFSLPGNYKETLHNVTAAVTLQPTFIKAIEKGKFLTITFVACVASVSVALGSKERPRNGILPARNWGKSQNKKEGVGEGKEGNACRQTPGF